MPSFNLSLIPKQSSRVVHGEPLPIIFAYDTAAPIKGKDTPANVTETPGSPYIAAPKSAQDEGALVETLVRILGGKVEQSDLQAVIDAVTGRDNAADEDKDKENDSNNKPYEAEAKNLSGFRFEGGAVDLEVTAASPPKIPGMDRARAKHFHERWPTADRIRGV